MTPDPAAKFRQWTKLNDFAWRRECGRFQISRSLSFSFAKDGSWIYQAWHLSTREDEAAKQINDQPLHSFDDAVAAVRAYAISIKQQELPVAASTIEKHEGVSQP